MPEVFEHFYRLMGTSSAEQLDLVRLDPGYRVYFELHPDPVDVPAERAAAVALFESIEPGAGHALERYLDSADETARLALDHFLYNDFSTPSTLLTRPVLRRLGRLGRLLFQRLDRFIAGHVRDPRLRQVLGYPAVFLGTSPFAAPSLYHLMSHFDLDDGVLYPQGGFREVIDSVARLAERAGARFVTGARVTDIIVRDDRARGIRYLDADGATSRGRRRPRRLDGRPAPHRDRAAAGRVAQSIRCLVAARRPRTRRRARHARRPRRAARAAAPHAAVHRGLGRQLRPHLRRRTRRCPTRRRCTSASRAPPTPRSHHPATRTSSCSCRCRPIRPSAAAASTAPATTRSSASPMPPSRRSPSGRASTTSLAASWCAAPSGPATSPRTSTRGADRRSARPTCCGRARSCAAARRRARCASLYFAGATTVPGIGLPMCLISAELVAKALRGDASAGALPEHEPRRVSA